MALPDIEQIKQRLAEMTEDELKAELHRPTLITDVLEGPAAILLTLEYSRAFSMALFNAGVPRLRQKLIAQGCPDIEAEIDAQRTMVVEACDTGERQTHAACGIAHPSVAALQ